MKSSLYDDLAGRIQDEYDREKYARGTDSLERGYGTNHEARATLLVAEAMVEIGRSLQFFVDEFKKDQREERTT